MLKEFKAFALKGNLVELAVAFILGVAFAAVVTSLVQDVIMPLIAAVVGEPNFNSLQADVGDAVVEYGQFLTALANFLLVALALFFIVRAIQRAQGPRASETKQCPHCLTNVPAGATACSACTRDIATA